MNVIDLYIDKSADFAKPILEHFRNLVHHTCPQVEEKIKWSFPHFDYKGEMMCSMAAFKHHCAFGFWKAAIMKDKHKLFNTKDAMGHFGKITSIKDLPSDKILLAYIRIRERRASVPNAPTLRPRAFSSCSSRST